MWSGQRNQAILDVMLRHAYGARMEPDDHAVRPQDPPHVGYDFKPQNISNNRLLPGHISPQNGCGLIALSGW